MGLLDTLFGDPNKPRDAANQYLNQIPGMGHQSFDPYINSGLDASGKTKSEYEKLISDPTALINAIMGKYKESDAYKYNAEKLGKEYSNTAAMGGIAGTPLDQMNQGEAIQKLLSSDQEQFLKNALGRYDVGLQGEEGIAGRGFDASKILSDILGNNLNTQAGLEYKTEQDKNARKKDLWNMFGQALGGGIGLATNPLSVFGKQLWS